nr:hypothetical protein [Tanacetum cinerariifolium]
MSIDQDAPSASTSPTSPETQSPVIYEANPPFEHLSRWIKDHPLDNVIDEVVHKELGDSLVRAATTTSSLEAEQDSGGCPRCQEAIGDTTTQTRLESVSKHYNDALLSRGNTLEDRMKLNELMALCITLQNMVLELEKTKTTQKSYEDEESLGEDASKQERRIDAIDKDEDITLVSVQDDAEMFDVNDLGGEEVFVTEQEVVKDVTKNVVEEVVNAAQDSTDTTTINTKEITLAQALKALKTSKPKVKGIINKKSQPKKKDQTRLDEEAAKRLQADFDEEERLARERAQKEQEANIVLIETWDDIQAKIDVDHQLAEKLKVQEQEELSDVEKPILFVQLLEKRRKHFAAKRA